jgi:hypothetical protein
MVYLAKLVLSENGYYECAPTNDTVVLESLSGSFTFHADGLTVADVSGASIAALASDLGVHKSSVTVVVSQARRLTSQQTHARRLADSWSVEYVVIAPATMRAKLISKVGQTIATGAVSSPTP